MGKSKFDGTTALITGGSSGIGLALAQQLSAAGANVWILGRDQNRLDAACQQIKSSASTAQRQVLSLSADVTDEANLSAILQPVIQQHGAPDLLFNAAGTTYPAYFTDVPLATHRQNMEVNYFGTLNVINLVLPGMLARGSGHLVNISSMAGYHGILGYSSYSPSKFAVRGLSDVLFYELKPQGIKVSIVFPPDTDTQGFAEENKIKPLLVKVLSESNNKIMQPLDVARNILRGVQRGQYLIAPGFDSAIFYTLNSLPWHMPYWIMNFMISDARRKTRKYETGQ
jgi:3-dehydrosphinganine reductase